MFCIKIAKIPIGIDNRYSFVRELCWRFKTDDKPLFIVSADEEEIIEEQNGNMSFSKGYCESLCIYRKICYKLMNYDAFIMHSAVVSLNEEAYVFAGPSGIGKTTHIRLWLELFGEKAMVVNGDKPIFRFMNEGLYACGTPWQGKENLGKNIIQPVRAVCFLERGEENQISRLKKEEVIRRIFSQLLIPRNEKEFDIFWFLVKRMVESIKFYLLKCNQEREVAQLAYEKMRRRK